MGQGTIAFQGLTFTVEISLPVLNYYTVGVGPAHFMSQPFLLVSMWLNLYSLSYRNSVMIVFMWFSMIVVL